jgi:YidC/Oxa1 family membrane protein insertase
MTPAIIFPINVIEDFAQAILEFFHDKVGFSWGAAIIGLTVVIRLMILPLTFKQVVSMQQLQRLQPEIKRLQERYKDDKQRMNQEMMAFYQEHKVNPLSSCFPLLLQLPFFIALFQLLRSPQFKADIAGQESFLFIPDLAQKATGAVLVVLIILYIGTQLGASAVTAISADKTQQRIMFGLPFVFTLFIINFQAGLIVYWITTNIWTIGQQLLVKKLFPKPDPLAPKEGGDGDGAKPARGKPATASAAVADGDAGNGAGKAKAKAKADKDDGDNGKTSKPPPSPRKKKKRSGRSR